MESSSYDIRISRMCHDGLEVRRSEHGVTYDCEMFPGSRNSSIHLDSEGAQEVRIHGPPILDPSEDPLEDLTPDILEKAREHCNEQPSFYHDAQTETPHFVCTTETMEEDELLDLTEEVHKTFR